MSNLKNSLGDSNSANKSLFEVLKTGAYYERGMAENSARIGMLMQLVYPPGSSSPSQQQTRNPHFVTHFQTSENSKVASFRETKNLFHQRFYKKEKASYLDKNRMSPLLLSSPQSNS